MQSLVGPGCSLVNVRLSRLPAASPSQPFYHELHHQGRDAPTVAARPSHSIISYGHDWSAHRHSTVTSAGAATDFADSSTSASSKSPLSDELELLEVAPESDVEGGALSSMDVELLPPSVIGADDERGVVPAVLGGEDNPYTQDDALSTPSEGVGGEPELEALLAEQGADLSVERISRIFPFPLDSFQRKSVDLLLQGKSVVVCAPTGAGKTAIAEAAAAATLAKGQRVVYTTPLKALSNQKLFETRKRFGHSRCGLQTGDASLNTEAAIVIMTTEILRNIMYRTAETVEEGPDGGVASTSQRELRLGDVGLVVLDEVHYLGDPHRGSVWEEVIINCPKHIRLLCMSATVKNPDDLGAWISQEHMECETIKTRFRPVPLHWHFTHYRPGRGVLVTDLLDSTGKGINPALAAKVQVLEEARTQLAYRQGGPAPFRGGSNSNGNSYGSSGYGDYASKGSSSARGGYASTSQSSSNSYTFSNRPGVGSSRGGGGNNGYAAAQDYGRGLNDMLEQDPAMAQRRLNAKRIPQMENLIPRLAQLAYLPAIWFILSRKDCDLNTIKAGLAPVSLTTPEESKAIAEEVEALRVDQPEAVREKLLPALSRGIASHHAGHLPGWKSLVERLFQRGLLKLVFATGTLAAGINMPARTTLISALSRMTDDGPALLPHNELLQMAGRAGRRGYDVQGHCVVVQNKFEGAEEAVAILKAGPEPLVSQFSTSYGLVLNLLSCYTLEEARTFVSRSFGAFMQGEGNARKLTEADACDAKARELVREFRASATSRVKELADNAKSAREKLRQLKATALEQRVASVQAALVPDKLPQKVLLNLAKTDTAPPVLLPTAVMRETAAAATPADVKDTVKAKFYDCLTTDNRILRVSAVHVVGLLPQDSAANSLPAQAQAAVCEAVDSIRPKAWQWLDGMPTCLTSIGNITTASVALSLQGRAPWVMVDVDATLAAQVTAQRAAAKAAAEQLARAKVPSSSSSAPSAARSKKGSRKGSSSNGNGTGNEETDDGSVDGDDAAALAIMARARRLVKKAEKLRQEAQGSSENVWKTFLDVKNILTSLGALEEGTQRVLPLGLVTRSLQAQNELWMALALTHPSVTSLNGPQLAAFLGALSSAEVMKRQAPIWAAYPASPEVTKVVEDLEPQRQALFELQTDNGMPRWNESLAVDLRMAGIVEAWAAGATWAQIMQDSTMDDGDVARLLIRTIDLLRQVVYNAQLLPYLRPAATEALQGMDRSPVAERVF